MSRRPVSAFAHQTQHQYPLPAPPPPRSPSPTRGMGPNAQHRRQPTPLEAVAAIYGAGSGQHHHHRGHSRVLSHVLASEDLARLPALAEGEGVQTHGATVGRGHARNTSLLALSAGVATSFGGVTAPRDAGAAAPSFPFPTPASPKPSPTSGALHAAMTPVSPSASMIRSPLSARPRPSPPPPRHSTFSPSPPPLSPTMAALSLRAATPVSPGVAQLATSVRLSQSSDTRHAPLSAWLQTFDARRAQLQRPVRLRLDTEEKTTSTNLAARAATPPPPRRVAVRAPQTEPPRPSTARISLTPRGGARGGGGGPTSPLTPSSALRYGGPPRTPSGPSSRAVTWSPSYSPRTPQMHATTMPGSPSTVQHGGFFVVSPPPTSSTPTSPRSARWMSASPHHAYDGAELARTHPLHVWSHVPTTSTTTSCSSSPPPPIAAAERRILLQYFLRTSQLFRDARHARIGDRELDELIRRGARRPPPPPPTTTSVEEQAEEEEDGGVRAPPPTSAGVLEILEFLDAIAFRCGDVRDLLAGVTLVRAVWRQVEEEPESRLDSRPFVSRESAQLRTSLSLFLASPTCHLRDGDFGREGREARRPRSRSVRASGVRLAMRVELERARLLSPTPDGRSIDLAFPDTRPIAAHQLATYAPLPRYTLPRAAAAAAQSKHASGRATPAERSTTASARASVRLLAPATAVTSTSLASPLPASSRDRQQQYYAPHGSAGRPLGGSAGSHHPNQSAHAYTTYEASRTRGASSSSTAGTTASTTGTAGPRHRAEERVGGGDVAVNVSGRTTSTPRRRVLFEAEDVGPPTATSAHEEFKEESKAHWALNDGGDRPATATASAASEATVSSFEVVTRFHSWSTLPVGVAAAVDALFAMRVVGGETLRVFHALHDAGVSFCHFDHLLATLAFAREVRDHLATTGQREAALERWPFLRVLTRNADEADAFAHAAEHDASTRPPPDVDTATAEAHALQQWRDGVPVPTTKSPEEDESAEQAGDEGMDQGPVLSPAEARRFLDRQRLHAFFASDACRLFARITAPLAVCDDDLDALLDSREAACRVGVVVSDDPNESFVDEPSSSVVDPDAPTAFEFLAACNALPRDFASVRALLLAARVRESVSRVPEAARQDLWAFLRHAGVLKHMVAEAPTEQTTDTNTAGDTTISGIGGEQLEAAAAGGEVTVAGEYLNELLMLVDYDAARLQALVVEVATAAEDEDAGSGLAGASGGLRTFVDLVDALRDRVRRDARLAQFRRRLAAHLSPTSASSAASASATLAASELLARRPQPPLFQIAPGDRATTTLHTNTRGQVGSASTSPAAAAVVSSSAVPSASPSPRARDGLGIGSSSVTSGEVPDFRGLGARLAQVVDAAEVERTYRVKLRALHAREHATERLRAAEAAQRRAQAESAAVEGTTYYIAPAALTTGSNLRTTSFARTADESDTASSAMPTPVPVLAHVAQHIYGPAAAGVINQAVQSGQASGARDGRSDPASSSSTPTRHSVANSTRSSVFARVYEPVIEERVVSRNAIRRSPRVDSSPAPPSVTSTPHTHSQPHTLVVDPITDSTDAEEALIQTDSPESLQPMDAADIETIEEAVPLVEPPAADDAITSVVPVEPVEEEDRPNTTIDSVEADDTEEAASSQVGAQTTADPTVLAVDHEPEPESLLSFTMDAEESLIGREVHEPEPDQKREDALDCVDVVEPAMEEVEKEPSEAAAHALPEDDLAREEASSKVAEAISHELAATTEVEHESATAEAEPVEEVLAPSDEDRATSDAIKEVTAVSESAEPVVAAEDTETVDATQGASHLDSPSTPVAVVDSSRAPGGPSEVSKLESLLASVSSHLWSVDPPPLLTSNEVTKLLESCGGAASAFFDAHVPRLTAAARQFASFNDLLTWSVGAFANLTSGRDIVYHAGNEPLVEPLRALLDHPACRLLSSSEAREVLFTTPALDALVLSSEGGVPETLRLVDRVQELQHAFASHTDLIATIAQAASLGFFLPRAQLQRIVDHVKADARLFLDGTVPDLDPELLDALVVRMCTADTPLEERVTRVLEHMRSFESQERQFPTWEELALAIVAQEDEEHKKREAQVDEAPVTNTEPPVDIENTHGDAGADTDANTDHTDGAHTGADANTDDHADGNASAERDTGLPINTDGAGADADHVTMGADESAVSPAPLSEEDTQTIMSVLGSDTFSVFDDVESDLHLTREGLARMVSVAGDHGVSGLVHLLHGLNSIGRRATDFDHLVTMVEEALLAGAYASPNAREAIRELVCDAERCRIFAIGVGAEARVPAQTQAQLRAPTTAASIDALIHAIGGSGRVGELLESIEAMSRVGVRGDTFEDLLASLEHALDPNAGAGSFVAAVDRRAVLELVASESSRLLSPTVPHDVASLEVVLRSPAVGASLDTVFGLASDTLDLLHDDDDDDDNTNTNEEAATTPDTPCQLVLAEMRELSSDAAGGAPFESLASVLAATHARISRRQEAHLAQAHRKQQLRAQLNEADA